MPEKIKEKITGLLQHAETSFKENKALANRYVALARKAAMRHRFSIPSELKRNFCKNCYKFLSPGINCRIRISKGKKIIYCMECKKYSRVPYKK